MKFIKILSSVVILGCSLSLEASTLSDVRAENESKQVRFSERVIMAEMAKAMSPVIRFRKEQCGDACSENGALEVAIGLLGISKSDEASFALINLFGTRLDGAGSEDHGCQVLIRGKEIALYFSKISAKQPVEHCRETFFDLKKVEIRAVPDISIEQICRTEHEADMIRNDYLKAIVAGVKCEQ